MKKVMLALATASAAALAAAGHAFAAPPQTFADPTGDSGTAPDVTQVAVGNDPTGEYEFDVSFASDYGANGVFSLYVDADKNPASGDPAHEGADFVVTDSHLTHTFDVEAWNGSDWASSAATTAKFTIAQDNRSLAISINRSELGNTNAFNFFVASGDGTTAVDDAPSDASTFAYAFQQQGALALSFVTTRSVVRGRVWTIAAAIRRSDTSGLLGTEGTIACRSKLHLLAHTWVQPGGPASGTVAVCAFQLPPKQKKLVGVTATMTVSADGATAAKTVKTKA